jgi:predicted DNA-binding transcriptional regulator AlpA
MPVPSGGVADAARAAVAFEQRSWIPATELAAELGISRRTLARWILDLALEFPRPKIVNHRLYFSRGDVEAWKAATAVKAARAR